MHSHGCPGRLERKSAGKNEWTDEEIIKQNTWDHEFSRGRGENDNIHSNKTNEDHCQPGEKVSKEMGEKAIGSTNNLNQEELGS